MAEQTRTPLPAPAAPPLIGREREQVALREALAAALARRGSLVLVGGAAGIGKTALAESLCAEATQQGARVLVGRCYDLSETPPYGPWTEALACASHGDGLPDRPDLSGGGTGVASQAVLFAAVRGYLAALAAGRPLVILLDDLHWADLTSLDLLRVVARGLADLPLLVLATYRSDELTRRHPLYQLLPALVREARAERLDVHPLGASDLRALVRARYALAPADEPRLAAYLADRSEGNPFFAGELLRALAEGRALRRDGAAWVLGDLAAVGVPPLLRQVIDARLDRLGDAGREVLAVAAVIGHAVPLAVWATVAGTEEERLLDLTERATEAQVLLPTADGARFAHALIREALYEGTLPLRRRALHRRAAEAFVATPQPDPDAVAYHFQQAGDDRAVAWLRRAGERADAANAWLTGAARYETALAILGDAPSHTRERARLHFRAALLRRYENSRRSVAHLDAALALALANGERGFAAQVRLFRGQSRFNQGDIAPGLDEMASGLDALDALDDAGRAELEPLTGPAATVGAGTLITGLANSGRFVEAEARAARLLRSVAAAGAEGARPHGLVFSSLALVHLYRGQPAAARQAFERARSLLPATGNVIGLGGATYFMLRDLILRHHADDLAWRARLAHEAETAFAALGDDMVRFSPQIAWLPLQLVEGRWGEARALAETQGSPMRWRAAIVLAQLACAQGDRPLVAALLDEFLPQGLATPPGSVFHIEEALVFQRVAADTALAGGDLAIVRAWLEAHDRWLEWAGAVLGQAEGQTLWARYHRQVGDLAAARQHAESALAQASAPRQPLALLAAHRALGELDAEAGRFEDARAHLVQALALAEACAAPYECALTLLALAELRCATGDTDGARSALAETRALLIPLEARPALARAATLASRLASGDRPARPAATAGAFPAALSSREVAVLRLIAAGLTNAQAAERLFVSPRTVDQHLRSIYNKLGVSSRAAASAWAAQHGLAGEAE